jgi:hypothetical protein
MELDLSFTIEDPKVHQWLNRHSKYFLLHLGWNNGMISKFTNVRSREKWYHQKRGTIKKLEILGILNTFDWQKYEKFYPPFRQK